MAGIKKALFLEKVSELQRIFEEEPLDVLQTIEFKYKKKKPKNLKKNETDNIENEEEVAVCQAG